MNFPITIQSGGYSILLHTVMEVLAFFTGFRYFLYLRRREGDLFTYSNRLWIVVGAIFGSLIGSRILGSLERPYELALTDNLPAYIYNNKTVVGGFLGGLFGVELVKKMMGEKKASGDLFVYPMILALIIGRIGCFSMGVYEETFGQPTRLPWGIDLGDGLYRHPVALYEIIFLVLLWVSLKMIQNKKQIALGGIFKLFMISYLAFRFCLDFIKPHYFNFPLTTIQIACLAGLLYYSHYIIHPQKLSAPYA